MKIKGTIKLESGLHIGGSKDIFKIGGLDSPVIKDKDGYPYIPGSSIKGKMRSLLEKKYGLKDLAKEDSQNKDERLIAFVFGSAGNTRKSPVIVVFRDAFLKNKNKVNKEKLFEIKAENKIDRISGKAESPRFIERVVPDTEFEFEIEIHDFLFNKYSFEFTKDDVVKLLEEGIDLLQKDYLGGSGTRGYGKVKIEYVKE
ncbi:MAG: type III-A CRISPR-associated RAMP protein Csm3 [Candidatus Woesearchaeota archaeon]